MTAEDEVLDQGARLADLDQRTAGERQQQWLRSDRLDAAARELALLAEADGVDVPTPSGGDEERPERVVVPEDLLAAAGSLSGGTLDKLDHDYFQSVPGVPPLDTLDRFVVVTVGCMAALADFFLVGSPVSSPKTTPSAERGIVPPGALSALMKDKRVTLASNNWLADRFKVSYDDWGKVPGAGFYPFNHRVLSHGHDPSPAGLFFALLDIASGSLSGVTHEGIPVSAPTADPASVGKTLMAPITWFGHLMSDVATSMGIPIPGSSLLNLIAFPVPGAPGDATVAQVSRIVYQRGYDLRHYLGGAVVPGIVEGLIRLYHLLRAPDQSELSSAHPLLSLAEEKVADTTEKARLASLLFWTHAIAAGADTGRVVLQGATGGFFAAAAAVNLAEWQVFTLQTISYVQARLRDVTLDQIVANRDRVEANWAELLSDIGTARLLYLAPGGDAGVETVVWNG